MSVREACRMLGLSRPSVYGLMDSGALPWVSFTKRKRLIPKAAVIGLIASNLRTGPAGADGKVA